VSIGSERVVELVARTRSGAALWSTLWLPFPNGDLDDGDSYSGRLMMLPTGLFA
jgi:hypothetical protein